MAARFILSLDCEGKWGSADGLTPQLDRDLSDEGLNSAYNSILGLLDDFEISATFAFAGLFSQSAAQFAQLRPAIEVLAHRAPDYLQPALSNLAATEGAGWHGAHLVEAVTAARRPHEIALHGVTHVPWTRMDAAFVAEEMALFDRLAGAVGYSRTFVYPRNCVSHVDVLARRGFTGYRKARPSRSRLASLLSEYNVRERPERPGAGNGIVPIPAGFFLNWQSGARRLVPTRITMARAEHLIDSAAAAGDVVHYWLHPENIATAPTTLDLLRQLLRLVAARRDAGKCEVLTQLGYCQWVGSRA